MHVDLLVVGEALAALGLNDTDFSAADFSVSVTDLSGLADFSRVGVDLLIMLAQDREQCLHGIDSFHAWQPECKIAVVFADAIHEACWFLRPGVYALLKGEKSFMEFLRLKEAISQQRLYIDHSIAQPLAVRQIKRMLQPFECLGSREFDVFCLLADGWSLQQIADFLQISSKTVSNCQTQIKFKLGLETKPKMRQFAKTHGLINDKQV